MPKTVASRRATVFLAVEQDSLRLDLRFSVKGDRS